MMELEIRFEKELQDKMYRAKKECKYPATRFNQMLVQYGGVETAKRLIQEGIKGKISDGFITLAYMEQRPDLTLEDSVCKAAYQTLFTDEEISYCRRLLEK